MAQVFTREQIAPTVAYLQQPDGKGNVASGTASFVSVGSRMLILTASHVAHRMRFDGHVIVSDANSNRIVLEWSDLLSGTSDLSWTHHSVADVAIIDLSPSLDTVSSHLQSRFIPHEMIRREKKPPNRDVVLTTLGFPLGLGTEGYVSPLTFESRASSDLVTFHRFDTKTLSPFFILQDPSIGGYSGGPVYDLSIYKMGSITTTGGGTVLHGIMHGTIVDDTGGKLAAVTPAYFVHELLTQ